MLIEPQRHRDRDFGAESMIDVRRPRVTQRLVRNQRVRAIDVVHPAMKVIRRTAMQDRTTNQRRVALEAHRPTEQLDIPFDVILLNDSAENLMRLPAPARSTNGRHRSLHAAVGPRDIHRQVATHRIAMHAESLGIDFRLLLQKRQPAPDSRARQVPVVVLRVLTVFKELQRSRQDRIVARGVELTRIDRALIRIRVTRLGTFDRISALPG